MTDMFAALAAPFSPDAVSWRVGSTNVDKQGNPPPGKSAIGMALAFIDARNVMDRLDEVAGPGNWQARYPHANGKTVCEIDIWVDGRGWVTKADGAGDTDVEAEKGALSDAFKRAAVRWGIGRYLYGLASPWVALEKRGRSWVIEKDEYRKLNRLLIADAADHRSATPAPTPAASTPAATPAQRTLADRASILETHMRQSAAADQLNKVWTQGRIVRADLDKADPERLAELVDLFNELDAKLPAAAPKPTKAEAEAVFA